MNRITVSGRLVNNPVVRYTPKGKIVCSLVLAVQRDYTNSEGVYIRLILFPSSFLKNLLKLPVTIYLKVKKFL